MSPVTYHGSRDEQGVLRVVKQIDDLEPEPLNLRLDLRRHSPAGPEIGYAGSGPAQLSLALLADVMGDEFGEEYYQQFKRDVIARLPREMPFTITAEAVEEWAASLGQGEGDE